MSLDPESLWQLLPAHLRTRDAELANPSGPDAQGHWKPGPLRELIEVISGQFRVLDAELDQLYDNHFVETAAPWAIPYLGELLGIRGLPEGNLARSPRAEVGHTVGYRRRKGTAPMLELLARDITGWPARAVEFFERLAANQHLNHLRPECQSFASLRNANALEFVGSPFETLHRTVEVRRIASGRGRWNIPNLGLFVWRLASFSRTASPLVTVSQPNDSISDRRFRVHPLGLDLPLQIRPVTEEDVTHLADPINVPLPLTRRLLAPSGDHPVDTLYGPGLSVAIEIWSGSKYELVPADKVLVCDLSDASRSGVPVWNHDLRPIGPQVALDPELGRIVFGSTPTAGPPPRATFHFGFSGPLGGGEYGRLGSLEAPSEAPVTVAQTPPASASTLAEALGTPFAHRRFIQILDSGRYREVLPDLNITGPKEIRASDEKCPTVIVRPAGGTQPWIIRGDADGSLLINGLWIAGKLRIEGDLGHFGLRHCTVVPGFLVAADGSPTASAESRLEIAARRIQVDFENCILPPLRVDGEGVQIRLRNCIVDAGAPDRFALSGLDGVGPGGSWNLINCTLRGRAAMDRLDLASNCLFTGSSVFVLRRQEGCVRFSWLPADSVAPRQYRCLTESSGSVKSFQPQFTSLRFGHPAYAQLSHRTPIEIRTGADDGSEMGAFHELFQAQREEHLGVRLREYLRFGLQAGVFVEPARRR